MIKDPRVARGERGFSSYADIPLGTVDASVVTTGQRLNIHEVATLDRRYFSVVRPAHVSAFELLP